MRTEVWILPEDATYDTHARIAIAFGVYPGLRIMMQGREHNHSFSGIHNWQRLKIL
jgi:hypothetical protein